LYDTGVFSLSEKRALRFNLFASQKVFPLQSLTRVIYDHEKRPYEIFTRGRGAYRCAVNSLRERGG
jgi:hypothetical protein